MGKILNADEVVILENNREYIMTDEAVGMVGIGTDLLPIVVINGKAYKFSREELINLAYQELMNQDKS